MNKVTAFLIITVVVVVIAGVAPHVVSAILILVFSGVLLSQKGMDFVTQGTQSLTKALGGPATTTPTPKA